MLPFLLAAVIAQSPGIPQIFIPGAAYDTVYLESEAGRTVVAVCDEPTPPEALRVLGDRSEPVLHVAPSACDSEILVADATTLPVEAGAHTRRGDDAGAGALELTLEDRSWMLRARPFSDGGTRVTLEGPEGEPLLLFEGASPTADSSLVWAGDLNGDGMLDLVLRSTEGFATFQQLFLSDEAGLPTLVAEVLLRD